MDIQYKTKIFQDLPGHDPRVQINTYYLSTKEQKQNVKYFLPF